MVADMIFGNRMILNGYGDSYDYALLSRGKKAHRGLFGRKCNSSTIGNRSFELLSGGKQ